jgi:2-amino-4-hydroxy-6-hydroxymethyldihydropteridine diphosphokinase
MASRLIYIALGSNLQGPVSQLTLALQALEELPKSRLLKASSLYQSTAIGGPEDQPDYVNAACVIETSLASLELLTLLQGIEQNASRIRDIRWGPRTLDLDIIWVDGEISENPALTLPHPRAHERAFVIKPLIEIDANFLLQKRSLRHWETVTAHQSIQIIE